MPFILTSLIHWMPKNYTGTIPLCHPMHSKLPAIACSYTNNEEEITASMVLRFYVVVCFVG
jgi:hypothetical protein